MEIIKYLGDILAEKILVSPPAARGLLKLAIKEQIGPFKPITTVKLIDLKLMINNSLKSRLVDLKVEKVEEIVVLLEQELILNQSLITITKV